MEIVAKDNLILATVRIEPPYPATTISGQTWMAVNMSGDDGLGGISSYTWDNDWGTQYYYTLSAAKRIAASMYPGWHVPTKDEWNQLSGALYLTYIDPDYPPEYLPIARGTALGDVMRGQEGWARAKTAYTDINVFSALPVDNYWFTPNNEWTYPSAYSGECYFIADDPTANSALHYTVENMYESIQTRLSSQYRPFEGYNRDAHLGAEMNSVRLVLDSTAQNTERPVIDKIYCVIEPSPSLPAYTLRLKYRDGVTPIFSNGTATQVSASPNIWDWTYVDRDWSGVFNGHHDLIEVMDCGDTSGVTSFYIAFQNCDSLTSICLLNTSNATNMRGMFWDCQGLTSLPLFNTHNVIDIHDLCYGCRSLTSIPLFDTTNVTNVNYMFYGCYNVQSGALALYNQMSTQTNPPSSHSNCFSNCGAATQTGAAELAQIPWDWK